MLPDTVCGITTRKLNDGTFWLPRSNPSVVKVLSRDFVNIPGTTRWMPKKLGVKNADDLKPLFKTNHCYIVGKGPSLDYITKEHFPTNDPVMCCNESVHPICDLDLPNQIIAAQQDNSLKDTCYNEKAHMLVSRQCRVHYNDDAYVFIPEYYNLSPSSLTVIMCIAIAKKLGVHSFTMVCFDACVNKKTTYAKCIGYIAKGSPERFLSHRATIERLIHANRVNWSIEWVIPEDPQTPASDNTQPSPDNPAEHRENVPA